MAQWLKQSTAVTLKIGPFLDETDGKTAETGLTVSQADVRLSKNGGNIAQKNESTSCTHDELGVYDCPVDTTDTGTLGRLQLWVHESGALPVWHEFMVVPANVWDSLYGADYLQTHAVEITNNLITAAAINDGAIDFATFAADCKTGTGLKANVESITAGAITATAIATGAIDADAIADNAIDAGAIAADAITAAKIADGAIDANTFAAGAITAAAIANGAIDNATFAADVGSTAYATNIIALAAKKAIDEYDPPTNAEFELRSLAAADYTVVSDLGTVQTGDAFARLGAPAGVSVSADVAAVKSDTAAILVDTGTTLDAKIDTIDGIVDAILVDTGTTLQGELDGIQADTEDLQTQIGAAGAGLSAVPWNAAWDAQVQSEVFDALDAAFTDATALTANGLLDRIRTIQWILRNKIAVTDANGNTVIYKDDSTTAAFTVNAMLTDDSTTTTRLRAA